MENLHEINLIKVGERIRYARQKQGLTQEKASKKAFITSQYWSVIETGRERASVTTYLQIAAVLDVTLNDIFYDDANNMRFYKSFSKDDMLVDCTDREKEIISDTIFALKGALTRNFK